MKKITLLLTMLITINVSAFAQFAYNIAYRSETYTPLTNGAASINAGTIWEEESYSVPLPFSFKLGSTTINKFNLMLSLPGATVDTQGLINGFLIAGVDLADRGLIGGGTSLSPIRYVTTGSAPNRIFKVELANAGFFDESDLYATMNDYINVQVWYYETSNIVEMHFGASQITYPQDYYGGISTGPMVGFIKNLDDDNFAFDAIYTLAGNTINPTLDSINKVTGSINFLTNFPANGTVYKFTPKPATSINTIPAFTHLTVYPTITNTILNVDFDEQQTAHYEVITMDGRSVGIAGRITTGNNKLDVSELASGVHILRVENSSNRSIYRFTKK